MHQFKAVTVGARRRAIASLYMSAVDGLEFLVIEHVFQGKNIPMGVVRVTACTTPTWSRLFASATGINQQKLYEHRQSQQVRVRVGKQWQSQQVRVCLREQCEINPLQELLL